MEHLGREDGELGRKCAACLTPHKHICSVEHYGHNATEALIAKDVQSDVLLSTFIGKKIFHRVRHQSISCCILNLCKLYIYLLFYLKRRLT